MVGEHAKVGGELVTVRAVRDTLDIQEVGVPQGQPHSTSPQIAARSQRAPPKELADTLLPSWYLLQQDLLGLLARDTPMQAPVDCRRGNGIASLMAGRSSALLEDGGHLKTNSGHSAGGPSRLLLLVGWGILGVVRLARCDLLDCSS